MRRTIAVVLVTALLAGCGTTQVVTSEPSARVYVDGEMVGRGVGQMRTRGLPISAHVLVRAEDGRREQVTVKRSFTVVSFLLGFITYGVCWLACWEYPSTVSVMLPPPAGGYAPYPGAALDAGGAPTPAARADRWMQPPPGWRPPHAPPAP